MMHLSYQHSVSFPTRTSGVTLLIAFLVMTMSFSLATGIFTLLFSEYKLSGQESDSIRAFYMANFGLECARYWGEAREQINNSANDSYRAFSRTTGAKEISCGGQTITFSTILLTGGGAPRAYTSNFILNNTSPDCAAVTVTKSCINGSPKQLQTSILSRGRVRAGASCGVADRVIERALEFTFIERLPSNCN